MAKKILLIFVFIFNCALVFSNESTLYNHSKIEKLSSFRIQGVIELRLEKDVFAPVVYRTLNHEGGMEVTVLEILNEGKFKSSDGLWLYVMLNSPMWVEDGTWIESFKKFLIFLPNEMPIFDFEK